MENLCGAIHEVFHLLTAEYVFQGIREQVDVLQLP